MKIKFEKGSILLPLISAIAVLAIVAAGYFFWQSKQNPGKALGPYSPPNTKDETVYTEADRSANWKMYTNSRLGISFKYPQEAKIREQGDPNTQTQIYTTYLTPGKNRPGSDISDGYSFIIGTGESIDYGSVDSTLNQLQKATRENCSEAIISPTKSISLDGNQALTYDVKNCVGDYTEVIISNKTRTFVITKLAAGSISDQVAFQKTLDQILSTFKFSSQTIQSESPPTNITRLFYHLPVGWKTTQNFTKSLAVGYDPNVSHPSDTNASADITLVYNKCCGSYGLSVRPYNNGSRHQFIYDQLGINNPSADYTPTSHEQNYNLDGMSCLILYGLAFSASGDIWGMCAISSTQAIFISGTYDQTTTEQMLQSIKIL